MIRTNLFNIIKVNNFNVCFFPKSQLRYTNVVGLLYSIIREYNMLYRTQNMEILFHKKLYDLEQSAVAYMKLSLFKNSVKLDFFREFEFNKFFLCVHY